jgi:hypothetical protein
VITGNIKERSVFIDGLPLSPKTSQEIQNHSPEGFNWGYAGSGPAQLALALLLYFADRETALQLYQEFKTEIVQELDDFFRLPKDEVREWIEKKKQAAKLRPRDLEKYCDRHLCWKRDTGDAHQVFECSDCKAGAPKFLARCSVKECNAGIPEGSGFYNFGGGNIMCVKCGEDCPQHKRPGLVF